MKKWIMLAALIAGPAFAQSSPSGKTPVTGTFSTSPSATFRPICGRSFNASGWGTMPASVILKRSFDGGSTWQAVTAAGTTLYTWTAPFSELVFEPECAVLYRLEWSGSAAGSFRISQ